MCEIAETAIKNVGVEALAGGGWHCTKLNVGEQHRLKPLLQPAKASTPTS